MANRLVANNYYDTGDRTEFAYDGLGRRVKIVEYGPGVTATIEPSGSSYTTFNTAPITLPAGSYSLTFQGLNPNGGNNVALVDSVMLNSALVANGSFESPTGITDYQTNPTDTAWSYTGSAGIAINGGDFTSANPSAPAGSQVAFVKNDGLLSQIWTASAGCYTLSFKAAQRGKDNDSHQQLRVNLRPSASVISTKNFVWCGNQICEERDASNTVSKRFFAEGEKRIGGSDAGNYYYSRDHLGSIREVTDSTGALKAQYDYDAWGNAVVVSGNMNVDFGFTGHYFHQPSGMNLALYRAYNPTLGRWISRDPIAERGGLNFYEYVLNNPLNRIDPLGQQAEEIIIGGGAVLDQMITGGAVTSFILQEIKAFCRPPKCRPCIPPVGTRAARIDAVPPSSPHWPFTGSHMHIFEMHQSPPSRGCVCFWHEVDIIAGDTPPAGMGLMAPALGGGIE